jgi:hypothetical protein
LIASRSNFFLNRAVTATIQQMIPQKDHIAGGYILLPRKLLSSGIMQGPPLGVKLFIWILMKAYFKDGKGLVRGQFLTTIGEMRNAMTHRIGYRAVIPTVDKIRGAYEALARASMITTTKTLNGMVVTVLNYSKDQNPENYETHNEHHDKNLTEPGVTPQPCIIRRIKKGEVNPETILSLKERYFDQGLIDQALQAISSTRKSGKVSDSILVNQLRKWSRYPAAQVEAGIRIYLEKDYPGQGKGENYLLGIIRNQSPSQTIKSLEGTTSPKGINLNEIYTN